MCVGDTCISLLFLAAALAFAAAALHFTVALSLLLSRLVGGLVLVAPGFGFFAGGSLTSVLCLLLSRLVGGFAVAATGFGFFAGGAPTAAGFFGIPVSCTFHLRSL